MIEIINKNLESNAYDREKLIGRCQYRIDGDKWVIYHTDVDENSGKMTPWIPVNLSKGNSD